MITSFYAPIHLLTTVVWEIMEKTYRKAGVGKYQATAAIFVGVGRYLMKLFSAYGMVLPISTEMKDTMPCLYCLLIPTKDVVDKKGKKTSDVELYWRMTWGKRYDETPPPEQKKGWSNVPLIIWIIGLLIAREDVVLEKKANSKVTADVVPYVIMGEEVLTIHELIIMILFKVWRKDKDSTVILQLRKIIETNLETVTKHEIYEGLQNSFEESVHGIYGDVNREKVSHKNKSGGDGSTRTSAPVTIASVVSHTNKSGGDGSTRTSAPVTVITVQQAKSGNEFETSSNTPTNDADNAAMVAKQNQLKEALDGD